MDVDRTCNVVSEVDQRRSIMNVERIQLEGMELMRLRDCATTTRMGQVDQGFPRILAGLAAKGLVEKSGEGYIVTMLGKETLRLYTKELKVI